MTKEMRANILLFITALVWGFGFVAQKFGASEMPPFYFNAVRFAIGTLALLPVLYYIEKTKVPRAFEEQKTNLKEEYFLGLLTGFFIFSGSACQQIGIAYTTVGNAAFLTACYIIIVPFFSIFLRQKLGLNIWIATILTLIGLYFLTVQDGLTFAFGDLIIFLGSFLWSGHILSVDYSTKRMSPIKLAFLQFAVCSILNFIVALLFETFALNQLTGALLPLLYSGLISAGIGFTLQLVGQKYAKPTPASLILSLEIVFAFIFGILFFDEIPTLKTAIGASLMFLGIIMAQLNIFDKKQQKV